MPPPGRFECIVFDTRRTKEEMFYEIFHSSVVLSIDEGGGMRSRFDYLIDTLPKPASFSRPNISSPAFLGLPSCKKESPSDDTERKDEPFRSVLVSFGGEDPAGLTEQTVRFLIEKGFFGPGQITAVRGPLMGGLALPKGVTVSIGRKGWQPFFPGMIWFAPLSGLRHTRRPRPGRRSSACIRADIMHASVRLPVSLSEEPEHRGYAGSGRP